MNLEQIIADTPMAPTIVNPGSKFVVVTYWWGRGNLNYNTARPCVDFYEDLLRRPFSVFQTIGIDPDRIYFHVTENRLQWFTTNNTLRAFYQRKAEQYARSGAFNANNDVINIKRVILRITLKAFNEQWVIAANLARIHNELAEIKARRGDNPDVILADLNALKARKEAATNELTAALRPYILELRTELQYKAPRTYDAMIADWETQCRKNGCNYMAVEYPAFARPGGYQLAINAKPLFIQRALESCEGRAVVYIDGDMTIRKYPLIFDMPDVDFMARGWHIDPRSSYKYKESILVDPYTFETSGGIMYFSYTHEARRLLELWIAESAKLYQTGKADDRIISMIFNTKRLLSIMKIIQLPIEYLWLTLDYDDSVEDDDKNAAAIYVDHPECLTSEDTAAAGGASSSRQPKFYSGIDTTYPRSETLYERVMFPSKEMADTFRPWLDYIGNATYFDSVEDDRLIDEAPFCVVKYDDEYGKKTDIFRANMAAIATHPNILANNNNARNTGISTLNEETFTIRNILMQLHMKRDILYLPTTANERYTQAMRDFIAQPVGSNNIEFIFVDTSIAKPTYNDVFQYNIDLTQPMLIKSGNPLLFTMFALMENVPELATFFHKNYQFQSRIRLHILKPKKLLHTSIISAPRVAEVSALEVVPEPVSIPQAVPEPEPVSIPQIVPEALPNTMYGGALLDRNTDDAYNAMYPIGVGVANLRNATGGRRKRVTRRVKGKHRRTTRNHKKMRR